MDAAHGVFFKVCHTNKIRLPSIVLVWEQKFKKPVKIKTSAWIDTTTVGKYDFFSFLSVPNMGTFLFFPISNNKKVSWTRHHDQMSSHAHMLQMFYPVLQVTKSLGFMPF